MIIENGIQVNCSEAILRINITDQDENKVKELYQKLSIEVGDIDSSDGEWDDDLPKKEFNFYDTRVEQKNIFGVDVLEIDGSAPYNNHSDVMEIINRYLPDAPIEDGES